MVGLWMDLLQRTVCPSPGTATHFCGQPELALCWRTRVTHDRWTVFLTNKCQTLEGVDHSWNGQSEAHSFCFGRKLNHTRVAQESERQKLQIWLSAFSFVHATDMQHIQNFMSFSSATLNLTSRDRHQLQLGMSLESRDVNVSLPIGRLARHKGQIHFLCLARRSHDLNKISWCEPTNHEAMTLFSSL